MPEAIQIGIFQLKDSIIELVAGTATKKKIDVKYLAEKFKEKDYLPQAQRKHDIATHDVYLFYKSWPSEIRWKDFIKPIAASDSDILKLSHSEKEGFILVLRDKTTKTLYAATGGFAHTVIQQFCDDEFGLSVLSRLITSKTKVLKAAKERNVTGGVLGSMKFFRGDFNLNENESFGNFYQELRANLNTDLLKNTFGFLDEDLKRGSLCVAKSSFTIKKSITVLQLTAIISKIETVLQLPVIVELSTVKKLGKSDGLLVQKLQTLLENKLYKATTSKADTLSVELCHEYFDRYYDAEEYNVMFPHNGGMVEGSLDELSSFTDLLGLFKTKGVNLSTPDLFKKVLNGTTISSVDAEGHSIRGDFYSHVCCELSHQNRSYYRLNKDWYLIKPNFVEMLNSQCEDFFSDNVLAAPALNAWNKAHKDENAFNASHIGLPNTLVFDKVCPENIEMCDILKWDDDHVYFLHVKKGFDNSMRDLCRQVHIAARRFQEDQKTDRNFLKAHYDKLANLNPKTKYFKDAKQQLAVISQAAYVELFEKRTPVFVLAVLDGAIKPRKLSDIRKFDSNIAKFCLHQLVQEMRLLNIHFKVYEICK